MGALLSATVINAYSQATGINLSTFPQQPFASNSSSSAGGDADSTNGLFANDNCSAIIDNATISSNEIDGGVISVNYTVKNESDKSLIPVVMVNAKQGGVSLDPGYSREDYDDTTNIIDPGVSVSGRETFQLRDTSSPVTVEITYMTNVIATKTFTIN